MAYENTQQLEPCPLCNGKGKTVVTNSLVISYCSFLIGLEYGYKACEKGKNIQEAKEKALQLWQKGKQL